MNGDGARGLRETYFEGFTRLRNRFDALPETDDTRADLLAVVADFRAFVRDNPELADVMFARSPADIDPGPAERAATVAVRKFFTWRAGRAIDAGVLAGNAIDIGLALLALAEGLAAQERAGWLGTSARSAGRRWTTATDALLAGFAPRGR